MLLPSKPPKADSPYAHRGTQLHSVAEDILLGEEVKEDYDGYKPTKQDMEEIVDPYIDYIKEVTSKSEKFIAMIEEKVYVHGECNGTADYVYFDTKTGELHVIDLKTGAGVYVYVKDNTQLQIYALGALYALESKGHKVKKVFIHVAQPAVDNMRDIEVPLSTLHALQKQIDDTIHNVNRGVGVYAPSEDACRWCDHKVTCPKLNEQANEAAKTQFENLELSARMKLLPGLKMFIKGVEEETLKQLNLGNNVEDFKLVRSKGKRVWKDEETAMTYLRKLQGFKKADFEKTTTKMLTVAQAEKALKKNKLYKDEPFTEYVKQSEGTLKVVPAQAIETTVDKTSEALADFTDK
jgi:hypothetical protein